MIDRGAWGAVVLATAAGVLWPAVGQGSGFAIKEQSPRAQGGSYAGVTAEAADITYMFFNPAALAYIEGTEAATGASLIVPGSDPEVKSASTTNALPGGGQPIGGSAPGDDIAANVIVPSAYVGSRLNERMAVGLAINVPFGLETNFPDTWAGRYHAVDSKLVTINVNPVIAVEPVDGLSLAAGPRAQYANAELANAVDFGSVGAAAGIPFATPTGNDGRVDIEADDWGFGYSIGAIWEPRAGTRIGAAYHSEIVHELDGDADFSGGGAVLDTFQAGGSFNDTPATAGLATPDRVSLGVFHQLTERLALMGEFEWTFWSDFQGIDIGFADPGTPDDVIEFRWEDTWFAALGGRYQVSDRLTLRTGVAYDDNPVPSARFRRPSIPDQDRFWVSVGASYDPAPWFSLSAAYSRIFVPEVAPVRLRAEDPGNEFRGDLDADFRGKIHVGAVSAILRF